jgi:hypothetical protein
MRLGVGWGLSALCILFMLFDGAIHIVKPQPVVDAFAELGLPVALSANLGLVVLVCVILYAVPRTAALGAILLTAYLGGAVAMNVRVGHPAFEVVFPAILGILVWGGLYLRDAGVRALIPVRRAEG